jgi:hypothetical protein
MLIYAEQRSHLRGCMKEGTKLTEALQGPASFAAKYTEQSGHLNVRVFEFSTGLSCYCQFNK